MVISYQFNYALIGESHKPVILFLHGFMGSGEDFLEVVDLISPQFCCLIVDLPGHGQTKVTQDADYHMSNTAQVLIELLDVLDIRSCFLAGYSMGGRIALYLTIHFPQYFPGVILESASPGLKTSLEQELRIKQDLLLVEKLKTQDFTSFVQQWYSNSLFTSFRQHPNYQNAIARRLNNNPLKLIKSLQQIGLGSQPSLWNHLSDNQVPILLLVGELDPKFIAINQAVTHLCSPSELKIVKNSGHNIHFEQPLKYIELARSFLTTLQISSQA